jgi:hypothetical protein
MTGLHTLRQHLSPFITLAFAGIATAACSGRPAAQQQATEWYQILRTPQIVAYLDTGRVERISSTRRRVWFRFVYTDPIAVGRDTTHYRATEAREEIDCQAQRARGLELRMETVSGASVGVPTPDADWQPFATHPLNSGVFLVACRATGSPVRRGGA